MQLFGLMAPAEDEMDLGGTLPPPTLLKRDGVKEWVAEVRSNRADTAQTGRAGLRSYGGVGVWRAYPIGKGYRRWCGACADGCSPGGSQYRGSPVDDCHTSVACERYRHTLRDAG